MRRHESERIFQQKNYACPNKLAVMEMFFNSRYTYPYMIVNEKHLEEFIIDSGLATKADIEKAQLDAEEKNVGLGEMQLGQR